ncbi:MAG: FIST signal transduction protein [Candidatus Rokuibacteriota bacterium]
MIAAGSGLSTGKRADEAALDAALQAMAASGADHADVAVVFTTGDAYPQGHALLHAVRRVTGARTVLGCSGAGVLTERGEVEGVPAVAVLVVRVDGPLLLRPVMVAGRERLGDEAGADLAAQAGSAVAEGAALMILPDARNLDPRALLRGLHEGLGPMPVLGGVAAGDPLFELYNTDVTDGALPGLVLAGTRPAIGVGQGCEPIGEAYVVTQGEGNVVRAIAGRSPLRVLQEAIEAVPDYERRIPHAGVFAGLAMNPAKSPLTRGDFLVRNLAGLDRDTGAVAVAEEVRVGQTLQFQIRDAQASREDLDAMLTRVHTALAGRPPAFGVYFNCAGRGRHLYGVPDHDVTLIRARLGTWPLVGFFGNGEFAPVGPTSFFHNYTGVLVVIPRS